MSKEDVGFNDGTNSHTNAEAKDGFGDVTNSHLSLGRRHSYVGASGCLTEDFLESVHTINEKRSNSTEKLKDAHEEQLEQMSAKPVGKSSSQQSMQGRLGEVYKRGITFKNLKEEDEHLADENGNLLPLKGCEKTEKSSENSSDEDLNDTDGVAWDNKFQYLLALLGWAVGLGNIWRFPYLCHKHGGGAFLVPYTVLLVFEAFPLFFLELLFGQVHRVGSVKLWFKFDHRAMGIGCASAITCLLIALYYNVILAWAAIYLGNSFKSTLPWQYCPTVNGTPVPECDATSPTEYYYYREVLNFAGWGETGASSIVPKVLGSNIIVWALVFFSCVKGISSAGKAMYVTVIFPIVVLGIFFVRSITLRGSAGAISMVFTPNLAKAFTIVAWKDAAIQTFFNLGLAYGTVISYSSFNPRRNNCQKDALFVATANYIVSIIATVTVFGIIGFKAIKSTDRCLLKMFDADASMARTFIPQFDGIEDINATNIEDITNLFEARGYTADSEYAQFSECSQVKMLEKFKGGPGLAFIAFAEAVTELPLPQLWAVLFFGMILMVGISSQIGILLGFLLPIHDTYLVNKVKQSHFTGISCILLALCGFIFCIQSGLQWLNIFDSNASTIPLLVIAFCECIVAVYIYGIPSIHKNVKSGLGFIPKVQWFWDLCWKFISPIMLFVIVCFSFYDLLSSEVMVSYWDSLTFTGLSDKAAPLWGNVALYCILLTPLSMIPLQAIYQSRRMTPTNVKSNLK